MMFSLLKVAPAALAPPFVLTTGIKTDNLSKIKDFADSDTNYTILGISSAYRPCVVVFDTRSFLLYYTIFPTCAFSAHGAEGCPLARFFRLLLAV